MQDFRNTGDGAGGRANDGRGKLALVPSERRVSPLAGLVCRDAQAAPHGEQELLDHVLAVVRSAGYTFPRALVVNYYVSLKTNPFVILTGAEGRGKTELARLFADALVGCDSPQYQLIPSAGGWPGATGKDQYYRYMQEQFSSWRFVELLHEAAAPANLGKAYLVCFDALHPDELDYYFTRLVHVTPQGEKQLNLPGLPPERRLTVPPNVSITATVNTAEHRDALSRNVLRHAGLIEFRAQWHPADLAVQMIRPPSVPPIGYQRVWLRAGMPSLLAARQRLADILGDEQMSRLQASPALARLVWRSGQVLNKVALDEMTAYIANSFDAQGRGLFDRADPLRNAQIAYDAQLVQRFIWRLRDYDDEQLGRDLSAYLDEFALANAQQAVA